MRFCQNISMDSAKKGHWLNVPHENTVYIQIIDPLCGFEPYKNNFSEIHRFEFLDTEFDYHDFAIKDWQAESLANVLRQAYEKKRHIIVSCHAGLCRSGAVTEVAVNYLGYVDGGTPRHPNILVKNKLLEQLGFEYDPDQSPFNWTNDLSHDW